MSTMTYKVVETSTVTDEEIERILNDWTGRGWSFASIQFVKTEASRRPAMAFLFFTRQEEGPAPGAPGGAYA
jgi:hypothetical protein